MRDDIEVRDAGRKGKGVFALRAFRRGEFIFRRRHGRIVRNQHISSLGAEDRRHLCELDYERSALLLPPGSYLNHSCEPNAMRSGVNVFAWRPIRADEEITIDYRLNAFNGRRYKCACAAPTCPGWMVLDFFALPTARQRAYLPFAPAFIKREYRRRARTGNGRSSAPPSSCAKAARRKELGSASPQADSEGRSDSGTP